MSENAPVEVKINRYKLQCELIDQFILYQYRLENPFPKETESPAVMQLKYQNDGFFHNKVDNLAYGVMQIVDKHIDGKK